MKEFERDRKDYHAVGKCIPKKDSEQLLLGKPVFMDDIVHEDCLVVKILRSPHAHALIEDINTAAAMKVPGHCGSLYMEGCTCRTDSVLQDRPFRSRPPMTVSFLTRESGV